MSGGATQAEKNRRKGARNENEAKRILTMTGWKATRVECVGNNNDPFRFIDVLGLPPNGSDGPVKGLQIKTNNFPPSIQEKYVARARIRDATHVDFEVWVREDYFGWHIYELDGDEWTKKLTVESCDADEAAERYRAETNHITR